MLTMIPPGAGGPESYFKLVQCLDPFGFSTCVLENPEIYRSEHAPFEEICDYYLAVIRKNQPDGPYHLAGWSRGAQIAHRIAIRLSDLGECVGSLILMDPIAFDVSASTLATAEADPRVADLPPKDRRWLEALLSLIRAYDRVKPVKSHCVLIKSDQGIQMGAAVASRSLKVFEILDDHLDWQRIVIDSASEPGYERCLDQCQIVRITGSHDQLLDEVNCLPLAREIAAAMGAVGERRGW
jgi:thioesterase domain-containing protein